MIGLLDNLQDRNIFLGSKSPRRKELLHRLQVQFQQLSIDVNEEFDAKKSAAQVAEYLAKKKSLAGLNMIDKNGILITADTVVVVDESILNKPNDFQEANDMLWTLSGREHEVITGVTVADESKSTSFHALTKVSFSVLEQNEIDFYINEYKPYDKAGSYGIQEWLGMIGIDRIEGSFYNVMGLPIHDLYKQLKEF